MDKTRRFLLGSIPAAMALATLPGRSGAQTAAMPPDEILQDWYRLILELVRHTATYSPPVASRAFAYVGITAYEAAIIGQAGPRSLAGQLPGLTAVPSPVGQAELDPSVILQAALQTSVSHFFWNTGPTGQRAMGAMGRKLAEAAAVGVPADVAQRSSALGTAIAEHVIAWSRDDGGDRIENMGFPLTWEFQSGPEHWVPTSLVSQQQAPLLPRWGWNRAFAMPDGSSCGLPPPPAYSEEPGSDFYNEAYEVYDTVRNLTPEQTLIARFWSDDPMLSPTPPGHWISIALEVMAEDNLPVEQQADVLARLGITLADAFIACWRSKFEFDLLRPVTYINRVIDAKWQPILITPPFPEYPSGHSTQSGAAAEVLTGLLGADRAFGDATHEADGLPVRQFANFWQAANEAGISRLYGGIHFRAAIERGLEQGRCVGAYALALETLA